MKGYHMMPDGSKMHDSMMKKSKKYKMSYMPEGVEQSPIGDIGKHRQEEAKELGTFRQTKTMSCAEYFGSAKPNQMNQPDYSKSGSVRVMQPYVAKDMRGLRGTGTIETHTKDTGGSGRPKQATSFRTYPMTGAPQGNESPVRGEHDN